MSAKNNTKGPIETIKKSPNINDNIEIKCNLLKDFIVFRLLFVFNLLK